MSAKRIGFFLALVAAAILTLDGCGGDKPKRRSKKPRDAKSYSDYKRGESTGAGGGGGVDTSQYGPEGGKVDLANAGVVKGRVTFEGTVRPPKKKDLSKDPWCAQGHEVWSEDLLVDANKGLKNVYVYLVGLDGVADQFPPPTEPAVLRQHGCKYIPHVLATRVNQQVKVVNDDDTNHNYHFTGAVNDEINRSQNGPMEHTLPGFTEPEVGAQFKCDVHPWMLAKVHIQSHPCFAVSAEDGSFEIKGVPPGKYRVMYYHERATPPAAQDITVGAKATVDLGTVVAKD